MKCLEYNGYLGSVDIDLDDNTLHGKLLYIKDLVTFEGETPKELEEQFRLAVKDYLSTCAEDGGEPDKPCKGVFNVRIKPDLHKDLARSARETERSLNDYVGSVLAKHRDLQSITRRHASEVQAWTKQIFPLSPGKAPLSLKVPGHLDPISSGSKATNVNRGTENGDSESNTDYARVSHKGYSRRIQ